jgi:hypothetical protein
MAHFTRVLHLLFASRFLPRRADARVQVGRKSARSGTIGTLVAAVVFLSVAGAGGPRVDGSWREWSDARVIQALPAMHALTVHRADLEPRFQRRSSHPDLPFAMDTGRSGGSAPTASLVPAAAPARPVAVVAARGYDATAPPIS